MRGTRIAWAVALPATALTLLLGANAAVAFDIDGFRSSMAEAEALEVLSRYGKVVPLSGATFDSGHAAGIRNFIAFSGLGSGSHIIYTCHGRLFYYQKSFEAGWHAFMRMFQREHLQHGGAGTSYRVNETELGQSSDLYFNWKIDRDTMYLSYGINGTLESKVTQSFIAPNDCGFKQ